jgi:hypothetical protein
MEQSRFEKRVVRESKIIQRNENTIEKNTTHKEMLTASSA